VNRVRRIHGTISTLAFWPGRAELVGPAIQSRIFAHVKLCRAVSDEGVRIRQATLHCTSQYVRGNCGGG
jgi:hypothetical protein